MRPLPASGLYLFQALGLNPNDFSNYIKVLRVNNSIDDILYDILDDLHHDYTLMSTAEKNLKVPENFTIRGRRWGGKKNVFRRKMRTSENSFVRGNNLETLYAGFSRWPDNKKRCVGSAYFGFLNKVKGKNPEKEDFEAMHAEAFFSG